jgi:hypothetical protein
VWRTAGFQAGTTSPLCTESKDRTEIHREFCKQDTELSNYIKSRMPLTDSEYIILETED